MSTIQLQGVHNLRDLGGIPVKGGRIRAACLIRSSSLSDATESDVEILKNSYHLQQIIDLRTHLETIDAPDVRMAGIEYASIPLINEEAIGMTHDRNSTQDLMNMTQIFDLAGLYETLVSAPRVSEWRSIFEILLMPREGAVLWHCTEGKDRCGLVSALVLYALGASMEDIIVDYLKTNEAAAPRAEGMYQAVLQKTGDAAMAERVKAAFLAKREYFDAAIAAITKTHGSPDAFLEKVCGVDAEKRRALRELYLTMD